MKEVALGIDIGGTNTEFGLIDRAGNCLMKNSLSTQEHKSFELYLKILFNGIDKMINEVENDTKIKGIGIGATNGNYYRGTIENAANLNWEGVIPITRYFKEHYELPVILTNDANAAAVGEMMYGGAVGMRDFIEVTLGTGLGSGIVANGELIYGHDGFAGEIGHTIVDLDGRRCGCGRKGCLETYASASGIKRTVSVLLETITEPSLLRDIDFDQLTSKDIYEAALKEDIIALEAFKQTGEILGAKLADTVAHTSPQAIFIFGGLANAGDLILKPTTTSFEHHLLCIYKGQVKILLSELNQNNAAILGASALVWKSL